MENHVTRTPRTKSPKAPSEDPEDSHSEEIPKESEDEIQKKISEHKFAISDKYLKKPGDNKSSKRKRETPAPILQELKYYAVVAKSLDKYGGAGVYDSWEEADACMRAKVNGGSAKVKKFNNLVDAKKWIDDIQHPQNLDQGSFIPANKLRKIIAKQQK